MSNKRLAGVAILILIFIIGCSGNYGKFKYQTRSESMLTKQELIDNWSDYDIWLHHHSEYKPPRLTVIVFDMKNDGKKILFGSNYSKVQDQEMWTEIAKENTTSDGEFTLVWNNYALGPYYSTGTQEIWGPENQLYGFIVYQQYVVSLERVELVDENTIRLSWRPPMTQELRNNPRIF